MAATADKTEIAGATIEIRRSIPAPRERVFDAWTQAKDLNRWSAPSPMSPSADVDLRVGGRYRIVMRAPDGSERTVGGEYRIIERPSKLVYTWKWLDRPAARDTLVTIEFHDRGNATDVILRHEGLTDGEDRDGHEHGWNGCLDNLVSLMRT